MVSVEASDKFEREGTTIFYNLNLNFVQAALGDTVDIPTVHGDVELVIPEGTQTGKIPSTWQGAPGLRGGAVGDQYVTVNVVTPTGLNDRQKSCAEGIRSCWWFKSQSKEKGFLTILKMPLKENNTLRKSLPNHVNVVLPYSYVTDFVGLIYNLKAVFEQAAASFLVCSLIFIEYKSNTFQTFRRNENTWNRLISGVLETLRPRLKV